MPTCWQIHSQAMLSPVDQLEVDAQASAACVPALRTARWAPLGVRAACHGQAANLLLLNPPPDTQWPRGYFTQSL